ncbi:AAA family ATPase [Pseudoduganella sp. DS3]|uniref:AAA family ATPase n=1 Tax=Pseudoduganella guangdongensis TaxID=2692179 RepID=A0A6N9HMC0_9BURK|nr:ATP-binding protein [Pseudoduganella guangdongensis]MYN04536.1 AAA family ATPase [Pseudoduganella guangdongensis]
MARMIPTFGPAATESPAEPTIYHLLKKQLGDDFVVIHSLPWLSAAAKEIGMAWSAPTGEIDFLILHAELGILAIEIKGGRYRIEGAAFVPIAGGAPLFVLNQVRRNAHGVAHWLGGKGAIRWPIGYAVSLPRNVFPDEALPPGLFDSVSGQRIVFDMRDLPDLGAKVIEVMSYWKSALRLGTLGNARMTDVVEMLCPQFDGTPNWAHRIQYDGKFWLRLTEEQSAVADRVLNAHGGIVTGWPGTGKTLVGIEVARRLSAAGERVLFLTFNALLCDHLRVQLTGTKCQVFTWHKLCSFARDLMGRPSADSDWFEKECLDDLKLAIGLAPLGFDVLVVDEAQALRPTWWRFLCDWFSGKAVFAFCDETQVFPFEKETTSLALLIELSGLKSLQLSVVLRMPRAVTERLVHAMPSQIQISSPRQVDSDSLRELVVADWEKVLSEIVAGLVRQGVKHSEIMILSKNSYVSAAIVDFVEANEELRHSLVSRFRGMEAAIVIVVEAHQLSDAELFSAYSRATTACFALYSADSLADYSASKFQAAVFSSPTNQEVLQEVRTRRSIAYRLSDHEMVEIEEIKTIALTWSRTLKAWVVRLSKESPAELWIDYIKEVMRRPVLALYAEDPEFLSVALPGKIYDRSARLVECNQCEKMTPHYLAPNACLICSDLLGREERELSRGDVRRLVAFDRKMTEVSSSPNLDESLSIYHQLPFLLGAAAIGIHVCQNGGAKLPPSLPDRSSIYRAAVILAYSYAQLSGPSSQLSLTRLVDSTWHWELKELGLQRDAWHKHVANALSRLYQRGVITKVEKGVYRIGVDEK